ncbi:hypothetical protein CBER1_00164 [Cercospora berteroae]|uniref:Uncharacterized protein n=1 Tax=Cercospora berteroae TaxID=357750 RepID=A0A2S6CD87_9PEZI|nr:hypothetical protein CBER1_00164 [Cercospora berteroae]
MRFEFTGAPPALLAAPGETSPFTSFSAATSSRAISSPSTPTTSSPPASFGKSSVLGKSIQFPVSAQPSANPPPATSSASTSITSITSGLVVGFGKNRVWGKTVQFPVAAPRGEVQDDAAQGLLIRALRRFGKSKASPFAAKDAAADIALKGHIKSSTQAWVLERSLRNADPEVLAFIESVFGGIVDRDAPDVPSGRSSPLPTADTESDATDAADVTDATDDEEDIDERIKNFRAMDYKIPRSHPRIQHYGDTLKWKLLDDGFIHYEQGAYVLARIIIGKMYARTSPSDLDEIIRETLSWTTLYNITELTNSVLRAFRNVDDQFRRGELDSMEAAEAETDHYDGEDGMDECDDAADGQNTDLLVYEDRTGEEETYFRFMDLPAELRNRVYVELLAPTGFILLSRLETPSGCKPSRELLVESGSELEILRVSKDIYKEAKSILYRENTVCVAAAIEVSTYPCIDTRLLPNSKLPLLASVTLVVDFRADGEQNNAWIDRVHWQQLQKLTTLKHLRICFVESARLQDEHSHKKLMLKNILERIPADCQLTFESEEIPEIDFVQEVLEDHEGVATERHRRWSEDPYECAGSVLERLVNEIKSTEGFQVGCKSGLERDYRFPPKPVMKTLQQLIEEGAVDPKIVLGGGN